MQGRGKGLRHLETSTPSTVADDPPEPQSERAGASRTSGGADERLDPGFAGLRQVRPLRRSEDSLELGGRGEVRNRLDWDETAPAAPQGEAHEERRRREPEDKGAHVGLPGDSEWPEESQEGLQDEEDDHHFDDRQRWDSRDGQE